MPLKMDNGGKRWVEMEVTVPGTPEQVWSAMATGPGTTAWFTKTAIEEYVGGKVHFDFGPNGKSIGEVTIWRPPLRFGYIERDWAEGAPPVATGISVTARSGGRCTVRMVHSLSASTDDWDGQLEGFEAGWPGFFEVLRLYLEHFPSEKAASFLVMTSIEKSQLEVWSRLTETLSLAAANVGEERTTTQTPETLSGIVERIEQSNTQRYILMRLQQPAPGIVLIGTYGAANATNVSMAFYLYGDDAKQRAAASEPLWREWLSSAFATD